MQQRYWGYKYDKFIIIIIITHTKTTKIAIQVRIDKGIIIIPLKNRGIFIEITTEMRTNKY